MILKIYPIHEVMEFEWEGTRNLITRMETQLKV